MVAEIPRVRVAIIGAGISGIAAAVQLKQLLGELDFVIYDRASSIGGVWQANTYPGCAVDVPTPAYCFSFFPNSKFSGWYPSQPEILEYLNRVVTAFDIEKNVQLNTVLEKAEWNEDTKHWRLSMRNVQTGGIFVQETSIMLSATGNLSTPSFGEIKDLHSYQGVVLHTAEWNPSIELSGKNVIVVGNGCSAAQLIPKIADHTRQVYQFMKSQQTFVRSANPDIPRHLQMIFVFAPVILVCIRWFLFLMADILFQQYRFNKVGNRIRAASTRRNLEYVKATAPMEYWNLLMPSYPKGCKRVVRDNGYLCCLHRTNIQLIGEGVESACATGVFSESGKYFPADVIILATGFKINETSLRLIGRDGVSLDDHWRHVGAKSAYKSIAVPKFPNLFFVYGPNGAFAHSSAFVAIETSVSMIIGALRPVIRQEKTTVEVRIDYAERDYRDTVQGLKDTVWDRCHSHYIDQSGNNHVLYPWTASWFYARSLFETRSAWLYF